MERKFDFAPDEYYHIYNRGTDKRDIFLTDNDWLRFLVGLHLCNCSRSIQISD